MKPSILLPLALILLAGIPVQLSAQEPNTLLWEISGNGLEDPSYLYGTMHVYDKRAFDFSDSVLLKFEGCSAFAAELAFDDALHDLVRYYQEQAQASQTEVIEEIPAMTVPSAWPTETPADTIITTEPLIAFATPESDTTALAASDNDEISIAAPDDDVSPQRPKRSTVSDMLFDKYDSWEPGDNPVVADAYLYRIAKKEGKRTMGLETADEQLTAINRGDRTESWIFYLSNAKRRSKNSYLSKKDEIDPAETMIRQYRTGDINGLRDMLEQNLPPTLYRHLIIERNKVMVDRAEPQMRREPTFIAVGAGHLAGEDGIIQLLRNRGYTVRPVQVVRTGLASKYREPERREKWPRFTSPIGAYSIEMPSVPISASQLAVAFGGSSENADTNVQFWSDIPTGITYFAGYYDSPYEVEFTYDDAGILRAPYMLPFNENMATRLLADVTRDDIRGYEATLEGADKRITRIRYIPRGNRLYILSAEAAPELELSEDIERFFNSFTTFNYLAMKPWAYTSQEGQFTAMVPEAPSISEDSLSYPFDHIYRNFVAVDRNSGSTFSIHALTFSDYFQATDQDSLFNTYIDLEIGPGDSIPTISSVDVEGFPARDMEITNTRTGFMRRTRFILRGNNLYTIQATASRDRISSEPYTTFFGQFSMNGKIAESDIYSDKSEKILADLTSDNLNTRYRAGRALERSSMSGDYIPVLHKILTSSLPAGDSSYNATRYTILMKLAEIRDTSATDMIRTLYLSLPSESDYIRTAALSTLAAIGTEESVTLFKDLILKNPPENSEDSYNGPFTHFYNNIQACRYIYPDILRLLNREDYQDDLYWLTLKALEDSAIAPTVLAPYITMITDSLVVMSARRDSALLENEEENFYAEAFTIHAIAGCARYLPASPRLRTVFESIADDPDNTLAYCAILGLVRQGVTVDDGMIEKLADDPEVLMKLYTELRQISRLDLLPATYRSQGSIAKAHLVNWLMAEYDEGPSDIQLVEEREVELNGVRGRAFLFKYMYGSGDGWSTGISGLQPLEREDIATNIDVVGSLYKGFSSQSIDQHFTDLLQLGEESDQEK